MVYSKFPSFAKSAVTSWMAWDETRPWTKFWQWMYDRALQMWQKIVTDIANVSFSCCNSHCSADH